MNASGREVGLIRAASWQRQAACAEPWAVELPWTVREGCVLEVERQAMRAVCRSCPVLGDCAAFADDTGATVGFWAGQVRDVDPVDVPVQLRLPKVS